jgi:hypothetical protein
MTEVPTIGCIARRTTTQAITKATVTYASFSATEYDDGNCWEVGQPTRITAPEDGLYIVTWAVNILPSGETGEKEIWIEKNGSANDRVVCQDFVGPADAQTLTGPVRLKEKDFLRFGAYLETPNNGEFTKDEYGTSDDLNRVVFERVR